MRRHKGRLERLLLFAPLSLHVPHGSDSTPSFKEALELFAGITDAAQLEHAKARYLGKAGALTELQKTLGKLPPAERPAMGARINAAKEQIETALTAQRQNIQAAKLDAQLAQEALDVTLPGRGIHAGGLHPVTRTLERIESCSIRSASMWPTAPKSKPITTTSLR